MKKIIIFVLTATLIITSLVTQAFAETYPARVFDNADLLSSSEESVLESEIRAIKDEHDIDIIILLDEGLFEGYTDTSSLSAAMKRYCRNYYSSNAISSDGIMLLISLDDGYKDYFFYTSGECQYMIDDYSDMDYIENNVRPLISSERFYDACLEYLRTSEYCIQNAASSGQSKESPWRYLPAVIIASIVIALISVLSMKSKLKTVRPRATASEYSKHDSFRLTSSADIFLYRNVRKVPKPKDTNSGGHRGGGSRGSFSGGGGGRGGRC